MDSIRRLRRAFHFLSQMLPGLVRAMRFGPNRRIDYSDALADHFARRPDRPALIGEASRFTWGELDAYANRVANWALAQGLGRGDVVALSMENRPQFVAIWLGLSRVGVVSALLNTNLTGDRLAHCVREADAAHWIVGEELVGEVASALPELEKQPALHLAAGDRELDSTAALEGAASFDAALAAQSEAAVPETARADRLGSDGLFYIYTSGTTGLPKAARVSHSKALTAGMVPGRVQRLTPADRFYVCLPLYHSAGGMMAVGAILSAGGALVIARKFSARRFWSDCVQHEVTAFQYIGELCRYMLNSPTHPDERRHKIRVVIGNGLRPEIWPAFQERFAIPRIVEFYGATEGNMVLLNTDGAVGAVGYLPGFLRKSMGIRIAKFDVDADDLVRDGEGRCLPVGAGEAGELVMKITGVQRFEGYTNESATKKKILQNAFESGDAYFRSGDLIRMDESGYFYFVDRIGDTFRWKGENVSTNEVAEVISVVDGVQEANVYGVAVSGTDGRAGMAALVVDEGFDLEDFGHIVERDLAFYARPLFVRLLPQMEITGTFKHRKVDLVKEGFDPKSLTDPVFYRDPEKSRYVPLDPTAFDRIEAGEVRI